MTPTDARVAQVHRKTGETDIQLRLNLDGSGEASINTGIGFFDHMLTAFARHGLFDLELQVAGDLHVDGHHTVEDTGICLGRAIAQAVGDKAGIRRYGSAHVPMDEALVLSVIDLSGRPYLAFEGFAFRAPMIGAFDTELTLEFFRAVAMNAHMTLHMRCEAAGNAHHVVEAAFKAFARALDQATARDPRVAGIPSTKGQL